MPLRVSWVRPDLAGRLIDYRLAVKAIADNIDRYFMEQFASKALADTSNVNILGSLKND